MSVVRAATAPGKLILLGEYAVLDGAAAWVSAVDRRVTVEAGPADPSPSLRVLAPAGADIALRWEKGAWVAAEPGWELAAGAATLAFGADLPQLKIDSRPFYLKAADGKLEKAGFGSSSAVVAAILALGKYFDDGDRGKLFARARAAHHRGQGNLGSGADIAAAVHGGSFSYSVSENGDPVIEPAPLPEGLFVGAVWAGAAASTPFMVARVLEWKAADRAAYDALLSEMTATAREGVEAAQAGDIETLCDVVEMYGRRMAQLGRSAGIPVFTPFMEDLAGRLAGVAAVKPSGAGGGDTVLVMAPSGDEPKVRAVLAAVGIEILPLTFGAPGARRETD